MIEPSISRTVSQVREYYQVTENTVLAWIHQGELRAINVGVEPGKKKPRWRITETALQEFELRRSATPPTQRTPRAARRKKQDTSGVIEFY